MRAADWEAREVEFFAHTPEFEPFLGMRSPKSDKCMEKRHDILRKASPSHKEMVGYTLTRSLPMQPSVSMDSSLVDPRRDSGRALSADVEEL